MRIATLYNLSLRGDGALENLKKNGTCCVISILFACLIWAPACHRSPVGVERATVDSGDKKAAAESIAEADRNYAQRDDLSRIRSAVTLLRQAQTVDYGNFEAAWKLARADYYLGSHSTDEEADNAFREGIESGKLAIQLQGSRPE